MPTPHQWLSFLGITSVIVMTPGPGMTYVLARSLRGGRAEGVRSAIGNALGVLVHVLAAAIGLSAMLAASPTAFTTVRLTGAIYLVYLGVQAIRHRRAGDLAGGGAASRRPAAGASPITQGVVVQVLNPKTALFFMALLPQFVDADGVAPTLAFVLLGLVAVVLALTVELTVAIAAGRVRDGLLRRPRWQRRQRVASGLVMIGLGAVLAVA